MQNWSLKQVMHIITSGFEMVNQHKDLFKTKPNFTYNEFFLAGSPRKNYYT